MNKNKEKLWCFGLGSRIWLHRLCLSRNKMTRFRDQVNQVNQTKCNLMKSHSVWQWFKGVEINGQIGLILPIIYRSRKKSLKNHLFLIKRKLMFKTPKRFLTKIFVKTLSYSWIKKKCYKLTDFQVFKRENLWFSRFYKSKCCCHNASHISINVSTMQCTKHTSLCIK